MSNHLDSSTVIIRDEQPPALSAFLSPASKFVAIKASSKVLSPAEVAEKIATLLKPGPPFYSQVNNSDLIAHLADASIMNSDTLRAQVSAHAIKVAKKSGGKIAAAAAATPEPVYVGTVWDSLNGLPAGDSWGRIPGAPVAPDHANKSAGSTPAQNDDGLWNGLMLSCDLDCTEVNVERSVVIPTKVLKAHHYYSGNKQSLFTEIGAGDKYKWDDFNSFAHASQVPPFHARILNLSPTVDLWSWPSWVPFLGKETPPAATTPGTPAAPAAPTSPTAGTGVKRVWIPSTTKISVHAVWWGYTIYLPSAVFAELDGDVEEAQKVANLVNTVLTYLTSNVPSGLPLSFFAAITVLKAIAPITGYISTFIGWSWTEIKSFDKGQGVQLSATWVLPVALIPRPWDAPTAQPPDATAPAAPTDGSTPAAPAAPATPSAPADPAPAAPTAPSTPAAPAAPVDPTPAAPVDSTPAAPAAPTTPVDSTPAAPAAPVDPTPAAPAAPVDPAPAAPAAPVDSTPSTDAPATDAPAADAPAADAPTTNTPLEDIAAEAPADEPHLFDDCDSEDCEECAEERRKFLEEEKAWEARHPGAVPVPAHPAAVKVVTGGKITPAPGATLPPSPITDANDGLADLRDPTNTAGDAPQGTTGTGDSRGRADDTNPDSQAPLGDSAPVAADPNAVQDLSVDVPVPVPAPGATLPPAPATDANDGLADLRDPSDTDGDAPQGTQGTGDELGRADDANPDSQAPLGDSAPVAADPDAVEDLAVKTAGKKKIFAAFGKSKAAK